MIRFWYDPSRPPRATELIGIVLLASVCRALDHGEARWTKPREGARGARFVHNVVKVIDALAAVRAVLRDRRRPVTVSRR
jgi:hypothetical protein